MSWTNVDNKHKKKYDRLFVSCQENYEKKFIIETILEEFPYYTKSKVEATVDHCCKTIPANRPRDKFIECLKTQLS